VVGEGNFSRSGDGASAQEADIGDGMVWAAERADAPGGFPADRAAGGGVDAQYLQLLVEGRGGHHGRDALGHH